MSNIRASGAISLLTTTFLYQDVNDAIPLGYWHLINLERPPFNLSTPVAILYEANLDLGFSDKSLRAWRIPEMPAENA